MASLRRPLLTLYEFAYTRIASPLMFRQSAMDAHLRVIKLLARLDHSAAAVGGMRVLRRVFYPSQPCEIGGVTLPNPLMLAAGFVKGTGFESETDALAAVERGENIIPGWRTMPALVGVVEFGSYTRHPRMGNSGVVLWRHVESKSLQNRVGLKNPGARAAAAFLAKHRAHLPPVYGINIAVSPGVTDPDQELREVVESAVMFLDAGITPSWFTLNLSCPNTDDDPAGHQTDAKTRLLCGALVDLLRPHDIPLWVKVSPISSVMQVQTLAQAFADVGVRAVIATNTEAYPSPDDPTVNAGMSGGMLWRSAVGTSREFNRAARRINVALDVIACGGIQSGEQFHKSGASVAQYYTAMIYRGPLAGALILHEKEQWKQHNS